MPIMSPRTQAMGAANSGNMGDQAKTLFDQGLSQMAYNVLINKLPNVAPDVVTFKVLDTDAEKGSGIGAFVISRGGQLLYVPVVMADNQIKPLDILYYKDLNVFVPLTKEWLEEVDKLSMGEMGQGTKSPKSLASDVDIRNIVVPPTTGRYSYAADRSEEGIKQSARVFDEARVQVDPQPMFLDFLSRAPNYVKKAAAKLFETRPSMLKAAVYHYGAPALRSALVLTEEKTATEGTLSRSGGLFIADKKTKPALFKEVWGDKAAVAFQGVAMKSYYAKDDRKNLKRPVRTQSTMKLQEPKESGAYKLWKKDGSSVLAFLVNGPKDFFRHGETLAKYPRDTSWRLPRPHKDYSGITEDGKVIRAKHLMGEPVPVGELEGSKTYKAIVGDGTLSPRVGQCGIFVHAVNAAGFVATEPVYIKSVSTINDVLHVEVAQSDYEHANTRRLVFDGGLRNLHEHGSHIFHMSRDYKWLTVTGNKWSAQLRDEDFISDPKDIYEFTVSGLMKQGAERRVVRKAYDRGYTFDGEALKDFDFLTALDKLARDAHIGVDEAAEQLKIAADTGKCEFWVISEDGLAKMAAEGDPKKSDPAQEAMDQVQMAQMQQPQGPSPVDMAVAEQMQNIQGQMLALQQQQAMLQNLQMRAQMIGGAGGAAGAPGAAAAAMGGPMPPQMMGAGQPYQDPMQGQMGGQPQFQDPMVGTGAQQPQMMQGAQPGGQPMQPGMQPGMDPSQQMPQAAMTSEDGSMESITQQVNPGFMDAAQGLNDAGAFDAAALSSMAQDPNLKDLVSAYIPNLEKALDNLGRCLLTLWMDESQIKGDVGDETYIGLEDNLRTTFKSLGSLILKVNQNSAVLRTGLTQHQST